MRSRRNRHRSGSDWPGVDGHRPRGSARLSPGAGRTPPRKSGKTCIAEPSPQRSPRARRRRVSSRRRIVGAGRGRRRAIPAKYLNQTLDWVDCTTDGSVQCALMKAPLDWNHAATSPSIDIAISKSLRSDPPGADSSPATRADRGHQAWPWPRCSPRRPAPAITSRGRIRRPRNRLLGQPQLRGRADLSVGRPRYASDDP